MSAPITILSPGPFSVSPPPSTFNGNFASNYQIFSQIGPRQRMAVMVYALLLRSFSVQGGFDYRLKHTQLFADGKLFTKGQSILDPITAQAAVWAGIGTQYTSTIDLAGQMAIMSDLENLSEDELWRIAVMLIAAYGQ